VKFPTSSKITAALLCIGILTTAQSQPALVPFTETFQQTFLPGSTFLPHWTGNRMTDGSMGQDIDKATGNRALFMAPVGEELPTIATLSLDLSNFQGQFVYADFLVATRQNDSEDDMKRTKLSVSISVNGGPFGYEMKVGPNQGFRNEDTDYAFYTYPFPPLANGQPDIKLRFTGKAGGGRCLPTKILIDNVDVKASPYDMQKPFIVGEVRPSNLNTIEIRFGEPVLKSVMENKNNYSFSWPDDHQFTGSAGGMLPKVSKARLANNGYNVVLTLHPGMNRGDYYGMVIQRAEDLYGNFIDYEVEELVYNVPAPGDLQITEVFFADPSSAPPKQKLQFVEIYNPTSKAIPLGGLRIKGAISAHNMPNVKLQPGAFWVITRNAQAFYNTFGFSAWEWKGSWIEYPTQHEDHDDGIIEEQVLYIQTTDHHGAPLVDEVYFNLNNAPWSGLCVNGYSMEWCNLNTDNSSSYNWSLANDNGAPYTYNYQGNTYEIFATPNTGRPGPMVCGPNNDKVIVCHQTPSGPVDLCINPADVSPHLTHGDRLGGCAGTCEEQPQFRNIGTAGPPEEQSNLLTVTPNPFSNSTFVSAHSSLGLIREASIFDLQGKIVKSIDAINQEYFTLFADSLAPGIYLLNTRTDRNSETVRIIVQ
ncbi:MAG: lamin tail domain-containing protein, partial [Phaeodactylibacter sp.]|nr:lamin tail domain-containing protein [Phaeodactylibacter sp.]